MNVAQIRKMDISNGPGVRVSLFVQGCEFHCKNCFNEETWDFAGGKEFNQKAMDIILDLCKSDNIVGFSILGGEPLHPKNINTVTKIAKIYKEHYPDKSLWIWSGFLWENYISKKEICKYADIIVDGQYVDELHDYTLQFRGSANQRVIDVKKSLEAKQVVLWDKLKK